MIIKILSFAIQEYNKFQSDALAGLHHNTSLAF